MQQPRMLSVMAGVAIAIILAACASNRAANRGETPGSASLTTALADSGESEPKAGRITPPRRIDRNVPDLRLSAPPSTTSGRGQLAIDITVDIDVDGRPDMRTLKVTGPSAPENRDAIARWIESGSFRPATDASGRPVRAPFKTKVRVRVG